MGQTLPMEVRIRVACYCPKGGKNWVGWVVDPETRRSVCSHCAKPAPMVVLRNCSWCNTEFIMDLDDPNYRPRFAVLSDGRVVPNEFECDDC